VAKRLRLAPERMSIHVYVVRRSTRTPVRLFIVTMLKDYDLFPITVLPCLHERIFSKAFEMRPS